MANTKSATAFRRQKRQLTNHPVKSYSPSSTGGTLSTLRTAVMDGKPLFTPWEIPRILTDPVVHFGLNQLVGPLTIVEWDIKAKTPEVAKFVENTAKKFWRRTAPLLAFNYFSHGFAPGVHQFDQSEEGEFRYEGCRWVDPRDATAVRWTGGKDKGKLAGFRLIAGLDGTEDEDTVTAPFAAWYAGLGATAGLLYDTSRLSRIYRAWLEKNTRGGVLNSRQLYFRTHAFRGQVIYHPPGDLDPNDPSKGSNRDYGLYIADTLENGSSAVFPDIRTPGEGRNEPAWRIEPIEGNASAAINILEYSQEVDREILLGLGIPPELVEAAETGSGFSGRQIPFLGFMTQMDLMVGPMVGVIEPAIRALVGHNYDGAEFTIDTIPLAETVKRQNDPNAKSAVGNMAPGGQQDAQVAGDAAMAGSGGGDPMGGSESQGQQAGGGGGGDPTGGGLVPYLGKRGGQGRKDPRTGRVYYLSHSGSRLGCLMADIPEPLADAVLSFANSIPDEHLVDDGRVVHPHVTILHGYQQLDPTPILNHVATLGSLSFTPGELRVFENDDADVLYVACEDAKPWSRWHRAAGELPHEPSQHGGYVPHLTVAHLKKGKGKLYAGKTALKGGPVPVSTVLYSGPDGRESRAQVWPSEDELGELFREAVDLAWTPARSSTGNTKAVWEGPGERKPLYGENAERVLRGDLPVAEKLPNLPTAQRVAMPEVGPGQKLVRSTDYRDGMEPPAADRPRDSLDREIAAANKKPLPVAKPVQKQTLPVAKRAEQKQPPPKPQLASRPNPPAPPTAPPQPKPPAPAKTAPTAKKPPDPKKPETSKQPAASPVTATPRRDEQPVAEQVAAGFRDFGRGVKEASLKKTMADVANKGHTAFSNSKAADMFAAEFPDWTRTEVGGEHRFSPPEKKTPAGNTQSPKSPESPQAETRAMKSPSDMTLDEVKQSGMKFFKTAKGSLYALDPKTGQTMRIKSDHTKEGHSAKDVGLKEASHKTVYVDPSFASALSSGGILGPDGKPVRWRLVMQDGKATLATFNTATGQWGATKSAAGLSISDTPGPGMAPLELWKPMDAEGHGQDGREIYSGLHVGNPITEEVSADDAHAAFVEAAKKSGKVTGKSNPPVTTKPQAAAPKQKPSQTSNDPSEETAGDVKAGFDGMASGFKEASDKKVAADVAKRGYAAFGKPQAADVFAAQNPDWTRTVVDGEHRFSPPKSQQSKPASKTKPPIESSDWEDEFRALQNRHDDARVPLKPAELKRLNELQAKAGVPEASRVKVSATDSPKPAPKPAPPVKPKPPVGPPPKPKAPPVAPQQPKPSEPAKSPPKPKPSPAPKPPPEKKPEPAQTAVQPPASESPKKSEAKVASAMSRAADEHLNDDPETKELVSKLDEAEKGGYHREAMFDLYARFWDKPGREQNHPFAPVLLNELKERYDAEPYQAENFTDLPDGWVKPAPGSKVMTGQIGKVIRPGLKGPDGRVLIPMIARID